MVGSPLGLSAENPVTLARIKCTHALGLFPTWNCFQTKTWGPVTEPRDGTPSRAEEHRGTGSPKTPFCLPGSRKKNKLGDGGGRDPSGEETARSETKRQPLPGSPPTPGPRAGELRLAPPGCARLGTRLPRRRRTVLPRAASRPAEPLGPGPAALPSAAGCPLAPAFRRGGGGQEAHAGNNAGQPAPGPILARPKQSVEEGREQSGTGCQLGRGTQRCKKPRERFFFFFFN